MKQLPLYAASEVAEKTQEKFTPDDEQLDALIVVYGKGYCYGWFPNLRDKIKASKARMTRHSGFVTHRWRLPGLREERP